MKKVLFVLLIVTTVAGTGTLARSQPAMSASELHETLAIRAEISKLEIVVQAGTDLGPGYKRSGDQLIKFNSSTNKWDPVRILGKVVHVTELLPGPVPSSLRE